MLLAGLGACAIVQLSSPPAVPQFARLTTDQMIVMLSDATVCRAATGPRGAHGRLAQCGPGFDDAVDIEARPNLLRRFAEEPLARRGPRGAPAPMGRVVLSDATGRHYAFISPAPVPREAGRCTGAHHTRGGATLRATLRATRAPHGVAEPGPRRI